MEPDDSNSSPRKRATKWCRSPRYFPSAALSVNVGETSSGSASERSVVMCGLHSAEPSARGWRRADTRPAGVTRMPSRSSPRRPPASAPRSRLLTSAARRRSKRRSTAARAIPSLLSGATGHPISYWASCPAAYDCGKPVAPCRTGRKLASYATCAAAGAGAFLQEATMLIGNAPRRVVIVGGTRIPFARSHGAYAGQSNQDLLTAALRALVERFRLRGERLGDVIGGAGIKHSRGFNLGRESPMSTELHPQTPGLGIPRALRDRLQAAILLSHQTDLGQIDYRIRRR